MLTCKLHYLLQTNIAFLQILTSIETCRLQPVCCPKALQSKSLQTRKHAASTFLRTTTRNVSTNLSKQASYICWSSRQLDSVGMRSELFHHLSSCATMRSQTDTCSILCFWRSFEHLIKKRSVRCPQITELNVARERLVKASCSLVSVRSRVVPAIHPTRHDVLLFFERPHPILLSSHNLLWVLILFGHKSPALWQSFKASRRAS